MVCQNGDPRASAPTLCPKDLVPRGDLYRNRPSYSGTLVQCSGLGNTLYPTQRWELGYGSALIQEVLGGVNAHGGYRRNWQRTWHLYANITAPNHCGTQPCTAEKTWISIGFHGRHLVSSRPLVSDSSLRLVADGNWKRHHCQCLCLIFPRRHVERSWYQLECCQGCPLRVSVIWS